MGGRRTVVRTMGQRRTGVQPRRALSRTTNDLISAALAEIRSAPHLAQAVQMLERRMQGHQDIVVGYDGSPLSEFALRRALEETKTASFALIHVVTVVEEADGIYRFPTGAKVPRYSGLDALRLITGTLVESWALDSPHQRIISHVRTGSPALALVDLAYRFHAERIILGRTGAGKSHDGIGSVARAVLAGSHEIPVDIVAPSLSMYPESTRRPPTWADVFDGGLSLRTALGNAQLS